MLRALQVLALLSAVAATCASQTIPDKLLSSPVRLELDKPTQEVKEGTMVTYTVTLKNATNGPVSGKTVSLTKTSGPGTPVINTISGTSDANGRASFTVASTKAGADVFAATDVTDRGIVVTNTATVTFTVGPVSLATSTVVASPAYVPADNTSASIITVTLRDATSNGPANSCGRPPIKRQVDLPLATE